jgi:hypothetical protein
METVFKLPIFKLDDRKREFTCYYFKDPAKLFDFMYTVFTNNLNEEPRIIYTTFSLDNRGNYWIGVKFKKPESFSFIKNTDNVYFFDIVVGIERVIGKKYTNEVIKIERKIDLKVDRIHYRSIYEGTDKDINPVRKLTRVNGRVGLNTGIHYWPVYQVIEKDIGPNTRFLTGRLEDLDETHTICKNERAKIIQAQDGSFLPELSFGMQLYPEVVKHEGYPVEKIRFQFECEKTNIYLDI